ncbi:MAG: ParA family protein [Neomegalonema sp.]|nr:ParA family protein [Neomegalonema sp.]
MVTILTWCTRSIKKAIGYAIVASFSGRRIADRSPKQEGATAMRITVLANGKGGCGKTTLATTLASALAVSGRRVALADADPQRSSITWLARRPAEAAPIGAIDWSSADACAVARSLAISERALDWLIVDAPADLATNIGIRNRLAAVIERADSIVAPAAPSCFDVHATRSFLACIEAASGENGSADILLVENRVRKKRREHALATYAAHPPVAALRDRGVYAKLAAIGLSLFDSARPRHAQIRGEWSPLLAAMAAPMIDRVRSSH